MNDAEYVRKDVHDEQINHLITAINAVSDRVDDLKDSVNRNFSVLAIVFTIVQIGIGFLLYVLTKTPG